MGRRKREHREAVIEGTEIPIRNEKVTKKRWNFILPHWLRNRARRWIGSYGNVYHLKSKRN
jgi:hypothetical protein